MKLLKAIPILYSSDVGKSVDYFTKQLKFTEKWIYDTPATFGGVVMDDVEIFFCKDYQGNPGTWLSILVDNVDVFYENIKDGEAKILSLPETKEWSMREMLIECPDGHILRVGHNTSCD